MERSINPSVLIGAFMALIFGLAVGALMYLGPEPGMRRPQPIEISEYRVMGIDCKEPRQIWLAMEEDEIPEDCSVAHSVDIPDAERS